MKSNIIFIHIPKTGGTTINTAMQNTYWNTKPDFNYRHIIEKNKTSNAGDIFNPKNFEKYKSYTNFMMLRHPIDKLISEYYFFKERAVLMDFFRKKPKSFEQYIKNKQAQNSTINFLKGRRLYDIRIPSEADLDDILDAIEQIPIHVGIFEYFADSMNYFEQISNIKWNNKIDVKRITFKRPSVSDLDQATKDLILECNSLDLELYEHGLNKFKEIQTKLSPSKITFHKDKYQHVIPYTAKTCLFEFAMTHKKFIKSHFLFFKDLTFHLLKTLEIRDGEVFTKIWNASFVNAVSFHFSQSIFEQKIQRLYNQEEDPLEMTYLLGKGIDQFFKEHNHNAHPFYVPMAFSEQLVVRDVASSVPQKKGFFSRFFKK